MSWITFASDSDFLAACASPEISALRTSATARGQADPLAAIAAALVEEIRGHVAACRRNKMGASGTIPSELKNAAMDIFRYRATLRLPGMKVLQDDARRGAYTDAIRLLERAADCRLNIEQPAAGEESTQQLASVPPPATGDIREDFSGANQAGA